MRSALLSFVLVLSLASPAVSAPEYLIVTTDALSPSFTGFAALKSQQGFEVEVITVEQIQAAAVAGRDVQEQIRTYIQSVDQAGSLRFVLLGGDTDQVPARYGLNEFYPWPDGSSLPTDLYYAALDGDWDADGDDIFGELDDLADMAPEVAIGRLPVSSGSGVLSYTAKLADYENPSHTAHLSSALFLQEVLFPQNWEPGELIQLDGADLAEALAPELLAALHPYSVSRLYENHVPYPGANLLTKVQAAIDLGSGHHGLVVNASHGFLGTLSLADDSFESSDALGLTNGPNYFVLMSHMSSGAKFDDASLLEDFVRSPAGGAIATLGSSSVVFPTGWNTHELEILQRLNSGTPSLGEAVQEVLTANAAAAENSNTLRWISFASVVLGDPEVGVGASAVTGTGPEISGALTFDSVAPNPFNPAVTIRFTVRGPKRLPVTVTVFDVAGRVVRSLWTGSMEPGPQSFRWAGTDDLDRPVGSGVYLATIVSGEDRLTKKMVLVR